MNDLRATQEQKQKQKLKQEQEEQGLPFGAGHSTMHLNGTMCSSVRGEQLWMQLLEGWRSAPQWLLNT
ncbi:hypothetical protein DSO57_1016434 [Entomophthora muscae]|uniref:Uncharacterized protein n=1 Tax=Entomophthora muscae TaxID=34485 RepID=A0ACC2SHX2_9FUNG|nr:hypothetical protein DSO57_1016434 [Entomophthora muscae]